MKLLTLFFTASLAMVSAIPALVVAADTAAPADSASSAMNMFGGPVYQGEPALAVTAALVEAGGGADNFSFAAALVAMLGQETVNKEVAKLTEQYSKKEVDTFLAGMDLAIGYSLKRATQAGIRLPSPAPLGGAELAEALVTAGVAPDNRFWSGYLFDNAISHELHNQVMADINADAGYQADKTTHKILNQAMYDVAQALAMKDVQLADLH